MVFLRFSSVFFGFPKVFLRFSYGFLRFETSGKPEENRKKTGRKPKENQKKTKRKPKENQKKTKRNPHLSVAKWRCLGVVPKDGLRGHSALDLICDPCVGRLCSSNMISGVLRCLWALQGA